METATVENILTRKERDNAYRRGWYKLNKVKVAVVNKKWCDANPEKVKETQNAWVKANPEKRKATKKRYNDSHKEKIALYDREHKRIRTTSKTERQHVYYVSHKKEICSSVKQWRIDNPEKKQSYDHERRAKKRQTLIEKFLVSEIYERDGWKCQLCHKKVDKKLKWPNPLSKSLDHIVPLIMGGPHTKTNVHLTHLQCNLRANKWGIKQTLLF